MVAVKGLRASVRRTAATDKATVPMWIHRDYAQGSKRSGYEGGGDGGHRASLMAETSSCTEAER